MVGFTFTSQGGWFYTQPPAWICVVKRFEWLLRLQQRFINTVHLPLSATPGEQDEVNSQSHVKSQNDMGVKSCLTTPQGSHHAICALVRHIPITCTACKQFATYASPFFICIGNLAATPLLYDMQTCKHNNYIRLDVFTIVPDLHLYWFSDVTMSAFSVNFE